MGAILQYGLSVALVGISTVFVGLIILIGLIKLMEMIMTGGKGKKIYARNTAKPATFIAKAAELHECFISEGCEIYGMINHSIISTGCTVGKGAEVTDSVIMPDVVIENGAVIRNAIIAEGCHIKAGARIGELNADGERRISVIGKDKQIAEGAVIAAGAIV